MAEVIGVRFKEVGKVYYFDPNDIDVKLDVEETGENAVENARLKARAYYEATKMPTIGI